MAIPRRFLPPMSLLCAFEAASRLESFTAAAAELNLTQSAVSRQIRALEEVLGSELFHRERQTVRLTIAGQAYARDVRDALKRVSAATLGFRANPYGGTLNLAILPTFGTRWLVPRLPRFLAENVGISINLTTRIAPFDFNLDTVDAAIHFGQAEWPGAELDFLMTETVSPACSPEFRDALGVEKPADFLRVPLLHMVSRPDAWERWFDAKGVEWDEVHGMLVDQYAVAAQAAAQGLGVALLPTFLIQDEVRRGELVTVIEEPLESSERYYLAVPSDRTGYPPLQAFRNWIRDEAGSVGSEHHSLCRG